MNGRILKLRNAGLATLAIMLATPGIAHAAMPWVAFKTSDNETILGEFDAFTGARTDNGAYLQVGTNSNLGFDYFGGVAFAPDGKAWVAFKTSDGDTILGEFDPFTGTRTDNGAYLQVGTNSNLDFDYFGGLAFAPDGKAWVAFKTSDNKTILGEFDPYTGVRTDNGAYLEVGTNSALGFDYFGGVAFAPDGKAWVAFKTSDGDTILGEFDPFTGTRTDNGAYLQVGTNSNLDFDYFGGVSFRPDGNPPPAIPEPTTWAMLITGFGFVGMVARRRRLKMPA